MSATGACRCRCAGLRKLSERQAFDLEFRPPEAVAQLSTQSERNHICVSQIAAWVGVREVAERDMPGRDEAIWVPDPTTPHYDLRDEAAERDWLTNRVLCLLKHFGRGRVTERLRGGSLGLADWDAFSISDRIVAVGEGKSSANLHMRGSASDVVFLYNGNRPRARDALQQLFYYMFRNDLACGFVSSSKMTYFVRLADHEATVQLEVSDPFLVGQLGYLRAWAWFLQYAAAQARRDWKTLSWGSVKVLLPSRREGASALPDRATAKAAEPGSMVSSEKKTTDAPDTPSDTVVTTSQLTWDCPVLGIGRHGSVRAVVIRGQRVALKEFADQKAFDKEVCVYEQLKPLQGRVIPRLLFVGRTEGYECVLGLELGAPLPDDFSQWTEQQLRERDEAVLALRRAGYEQEDFEGRNFVVLPSTNRVAVVDLESVRPHDRRKRKATVCSQ